ncbi:MAG TPA: YciI family protein [Steroidobacteraceae bacterium]|nr:YciI family protein [Steroidobacteraceae bacterium]
MKVMVLAKATVDSEAGVMPSKELIREMGEFNESLAAAGIMLAGEGLKPSQYGKRILLSGKERIIVDGPFELKELLGGFWLWQVNSMEEALDWIKRCPNPTFPDWQIEIRPVYEPKDFANTSIGESG